MTALAAAKVGHWRLTMVSEADKESNDDWLREKYLAKMAITTAQLMLNAFWGPSNISCGAQSEVICSSGRGLAVTEKSLNVRTCSSFSPINDGWWPFFSRQAVANVAEKWVGPFVIIDM